METNPFEPPSELADQAVQPVTSGDSRGVKVYVPNHVGLAAFLGSPLAGAWILGANYAALGRSADRTKALVVGFIATVALFAIAVVLPEGTPNFLPIVYTLALREYAKRVQGKDIDRVLATGGAKYSAWRAAGIGLLYLTVLIGLMILYV
ncbi:MAG TPA: hypothetical protein VMS65_15845, partial [Polyangiaceae bacterium]|nr:hypothetical protein [Polyangiaceae bacterium]